MEKTLGNTDASQAKVNVKDLALWGDGDTFKLISKASSKREGWMKSTKAMEIKGVGCLVQVTTQQGDNIAEALELVPDTKIAETLSEEEGDIEGTVVSRKLVSDGGYNELLRLVEGAKVQASEEIAKLRTEAKNNAFTAFADGLKAGSETTNEAWMNKSLFARIFKK